MIQQIGMNQGRFWETTPRQKSGSCSFSEVFHAEQDDDLLCELQLPINDYSSYPSITVISRYMKYHFASLVKILSLPATMPKMKLRSIYRGVLTSIPQVHYKFFCYNAEKLAGSGF